MLKVVNRFSSVRNCSLTVKKKVAENRDLDLPLKPKSKSDDKVILLRTELTKFYLFSPIYFFDVYKFIIKLFPHRISAQAFRRLGLRLKKYEEDDLILLFFSFLSYSQGYMNGCV